MNRNFKVFLAVWLIAVAMFNVTCFAIPGGETGKFSSSYWVSYAFIMLAYLGLLVCFYFVFRKIFPKEVFYNVPIVLVAYIGLAAMTIAGTMGMVSKDFPTWLGVTICFVVLGTTAIIAIVSGLNAVIMKEMDDAQTRESYPLRTMTVRARTIAGKTDDPEIKKIAKDVVAALRYSDPVSNIMLSKIDAKISRELKEFGEAVEGGDAELAKARGKTLLGMISERSEMCKLNK